MTKQPGRLLRADFKYLMSLLRKVQEEAEEEIENDGNNKAKARLTMRKLTRIRLVLIDFDQSEK
jgi:hypothetical protein